MSRVGESLRLTKSRAALGVLLAAIGLLSGCGIGKKNSSLQEIRNTVVCGRGTYLEGLTFDEGGNVRTEGATRVAYLDLPHGEQVRVYDPEHKADSLARRGDQDRSDQADRNVDATRGLGAIFRLTLNSQGEVTNVQRREPLTADQVNAACGRPVMSTGG